ncbi:MAG: class I SAM-dependent methyltransferase [Spirochaetaceae bacterium]|nr:class I SAM-dependent methyltransferase [Spirochaetaceae bacterium]
MAKNINNHLRNHYSNYNLLFLKRYFNELNIKDKILDVGTGHFRNLKLFYEVGFKDLWGIDKNDPEPLPHKNFKANFCKKDIENGLPYPGETFDVVICNYVLMFISPKRLNFVLEELLRVSKGFLIIETFKHPDKAKTTDVMDYDFKDIVRFFENRNDIEILDKKVYYEKILVRRKPICQEKALK